MIYLDDRQILRKVSRKIKERHFLSKIHDLAHF